MADDYPDPPEVETCYLCGRAAVMPRRVFYTGVDDYPIPICKRAGCAPERDHLREQVREAMMDYWPIVNRFQVKSDAQQCGAVLAGGRYA